MRIKSSNDQKTTAEPLTSLQGEGGLGAIKGEWTLAQLAEQFDVHPNQITLGKRSSKSAANVFGPGSGASQVASSTNVKALHAKIGELTLENAPFAAGAIVAPAHHDGSLPSGHAYCHVPIR